MKKLVFITFGLIFSLNLANASDLLFKATNGTLSENSVGVKKLSDEEMKKVLGGLYYTNPIFQHRQTNSLGQSIASYYVYVSLTSNENRIQSVSLNNGVSGYRNYISFITYAKAGTPIIHIQHNETLNYKTYAFAVRGFATYYIADSFGKSVVNQCRFCR